jgi:hypothetical protein
MMRTWGLVLAALVAGLQFASAAVVSQLDFASQKDEKAVIVPPDCINSG